MRSFKRTSSFSSRLKFRSPRGGNGRGLGLKVEEGAGLPGARGMMGLGLGDGVDPVLGAAGLEGGLILNAM